MLRLRPVVADLARCAGRLHGLRIQHQCMHLAGRERAEPGRTGGGRLVSPLARLSGGRGRSVDQRGLGGQRRRLRGGTRRGRPPRTRNRVHERPEPQLAGQGGPDRRRPAGPHPPAAERRAVPPGPGIAGARRGRRPRCGVQSDCRMRQCRHRQHGCHRSVAGAGGLLRGGRDLAARRRRLRRLRGGDRARQAAPQRDRSRRLRRGWTRTSGCFSRTRRARCW